MQILSSEADSLLLGLRRGGLRKYSKDVQSLDVSLEDPVRRMMPQMELRIRKQA